MNKCNLMLHCGANAVERDKLALVATPDKTDTWCPISHDSLIRGVQTTLESNGMKVVHEAHALHKGGMRYFGLMQVTTGDDANDFGLVAGVRNSHDKSFPASLVLGASVFVCDNLSFSGEIKLSRKHTVHIERDLPALILRAVGALSNLRMDQEKFFTRSKLIEVSDVQAHDVMVRAIDARILPNQKLPELLQEWRHPRHPEFQERTVWRLMNSFTEVLKGSLAMLPKRTVGLQGMLKATFNINDNVPAAAMEASLADAEIQVGQAL